MPIYLTVYKGKILNIGGAEVKLSIKDIGICFTLGIFYRTEIMHL